MSEEQVAYDALPVPSKDMARQMQIVDGRISVNTLQEAYYLCKILARSGMVPKDKNGPDGAEKCLAAYLYGSNIGLDIMTSIQSVAVVGNVPAVWGDAMLALVRNSKSLERWVEMEYQFDKEAVACICLAKRKDIGQDIDVVKLRSDRMEWADILELAILSGWYGNIYSDYDITDAGLESKDTYQKHRRRMRKMRARAFTLRDGWPDILKGIHAREEMDPDQKEPIPVGSGTVDLAAQLTAAPQVVKAIPFTQGPVLPKKETTPPPAPPESPKVEEPAAPSTDLVTEAVPKAPVIQGLEDRKNIKDQAKVVDCPVCKGIGGDKETGYCRHCGGSGKMAAEKAHLMTNAESEDYHPAAVVDAGSPPWEDSGDDPPPAGEQPPEAPADPPADQEKKDPTVDQEQDKISELENKIKAFIRNDAGIETDKDKKYWHDKVIFCLLGQCRKANAAVKPGYPLNVSLEDVYAEFLKSPAESFERIKASFAEHVSESVGSKGHRSSTMRRAKAQDTLPLGKDQSDPKKAELDALRKELEELKTKYPGYVMQCQHSAQMAIGVIPSTIDGCNFLIKQVKAMLAERPPKNGK
jgi:hypothetical protein